MANRDTENTSAPVSTDDQALLETARNRFEQAVEAESDNRKEALDDLEFLSGKQWPDDIKNNRDQDGRPCLTINRLPQFTRQITNDQRMNRPSIKVNPVDDHADVDTAKVLQGLIKHIEANSNADVAYDTAFAAAASTGLGFFRIVTDFRDPNSFEQDIFIKRIRNRFSVYVDPHSQEPDGSDYNWAFVFEDVPEEEYRAQFKGSKLSMMTDWTSLGDQAPGWIKKGTARVAEYFYKTFEETEIVLLSDKTSMKKSELPTVLPPGVTVVAERMTILPAIKWCKMNGIEVLECTDWPGQWIPIIPVLGDELDINGKRILEGIVRHAKDPQRMYNYWASAETETIALAPRAPFIGAEGQFEGHEAAWKTANVKNHAYLQYKPKTIAGVPVGPPNRNVFEPPVQAITQARMQSSEDLKATTGIYDAALGNRSNENSGVAIQRRNQQAQTSNFHYVDNLSRAIRHAGRILVDLIPWVYDTARAIRILGEDGEPEMVAINQIFQEGGKPKIHDLNIGEYDVSVAAGPNFATRRQEAAASMLDLSKAAPQLMQFAGDLLVKNMDWPGAQEIADRIKKSIPPEIIGDDGKDKPPIPPEIQQQMAQMSQMVEQLTQQLNQANDEKDTKAVELESKERIEMEKLRVQMLVEFFKVDSKEAMALLAHEVAAIGQRQQLLHVNEPIPETGEQSAVMPEPQEQPPTGGFSPGQPMEQ